MEWISTVAQSHVRLHWEQSVLAHNFQKQSFYSVVTTLEANGPRQANGPCTREANLAQSERTQVTCSVNPPSPCWPLLQALQEVLEGKEVLDIASEKVVLLKLVKILSTGASAARQVWWGPA